MLNQLQAVFACLQRHDVKYVVIGGIAAILHGVPRATFDLDVLIEATDENARRLLDALDGRVGSFEVSHPYADADLFTIDYDQTNNVLDLTHNNYAPMRITRTSDTSWGAKL